VVQCSGPEPSGRPPPPEAGGDPIDVELAKGAAGTEADQVRRIFDDLAHRWDEAANDTKPGDSVSSTEQVGIPCDDLRGAAALDEDWFVVPITASGCIGVKKERDGLRVRDQTGSWKCQRKGNPT